MADAKRAENSRIDCVENMFVNRVYCVGSVWLVGGGSARLDH